MDIIPQNFENWKICIEKRCGVPLTLTFARARLAVYEDETLAETRRFVNLYGKEHLENIKNWFRRIVEKEKEVTSRI